MFQFILFKTAASESPLYKEDNSQLECQQRKVLMWVDVRGNL